MNNTTRQLWMVALLNEKLDFVWHVCAPMSTLPKTAPKSPTMATFSITTYTANKKSNLNAPESENTWSSIKKDNTPYKLTTCSITHIPQYNQCFQPLYWISINA